MSLSAVDVREGRVLRYLWDLGLCKPDRFEAWADALIARLDEPPYPLIELSLAKARGFVSESLDQVLGTGIDAGEMILALASVEPDEWSSKQLCHALETVSHHAIRLEMDTPAQDERMIAILHDAFQAYDTQYFVQIGHITEAALRRELSDYFRKVREFAASIEAMS